MKQVKKIMFVMIASLSTMSLFSFKSANTNELALQNANVTAYASLSQVDPGDPVYFTGAIIRTVKKVLTADSKAIVVKVLTSIVFSESGQASAADLQAKKESLLAKL